MFEGAFTLSNFYMIAGFLLSMYACVSNDIIQTLGTFLSANKKTPFYYLWAFSVIVLVITIVTGWIVNNGDMSFGLLTRIPVTEHYTFLYLLPPIILILLTRWDDLWRDIFITPKNVPEILKFQNGGWLPNGALLHSSGPNGLYRILQSCLYIYQERHLSQNYYLYF